MSIYYYFFLIIGLSLISISIRYFILWKKNIPVELFVEGLRNENNGHFEEAIITYETALNEFKKIRYHSNLKKIITGKIKVLHTVIEYKNNLHFTR